MNKFDTSALKAALPMFLDMAAPVVSFVILRGIFGADPVIALSVGAAAAGLRTCYRAVRERRLNAFSVMMLVLLGATILLVFLTGDARLVLAKSAVLPFAGGVYGIITNFAGRALIFDVVEPFVTKGQPGRRTAWEACWTEDAAFRRRIRLINLIWGIGFILSAVARVVVIYQVPLDVAVFAGQAPTLLTLAILILWTKYLVPPLAAALRARIPDEEPAALPHTVVTAES